MSYSNRETNNDARRFTSLDCARLSFFGITIHAKFAVNTQSWFITKT